MLGETALELIREVLRTPDTLTPFNEEKVNTLFSRL